MLPALRQFHPFLLILPVALCLLGSGMNNETAYAGSMDKIVGGNATTPGDWPSTVALLDHGGPDALSSQFCGGTLIAPNWVLTAAHCTAGLSAGEIDAVIGRHDLSSTTGERIQVAAVRNHPGYDDVTSDGDLSLLYLSSNSTQTTISVIAEGDPNNRAAAGVNGVTVGWGATSEGGTGSSTLLQVGVPVISNAVANQADWYNGDVTANMLAAGFAAGGKDSCQGDSGGPFMVPDGAGGWLLAGAVSWGDGCAQPKKPGIYTRLSEYSDWIDETMSTDPTTVPGLNPWGMLGAAALLAVIGVRCRRPRA